MGILSRDAFDQTQQGNGSFRKFLEKYPDIVQIERDGTTVYVSFQQQTKTSPMALHKKYRSGLKRQRIRVVPATIRFVILRDALRILSDQSDLRWRQLIDILATTYKKEEQNISKNMINDLLLVARQAQVIRTLKGKSLATAPIILQLEGDHVFQEAVVRCDAAYLREILELGEPFDIREASLALYDSPKYINYLEMIMSKWLDE